MATKTVTLGHPDGHHKHLELTITISSQASLPQSVNITDQQGHTLVKKKGVFDYFSETVRYEDSKSVFLATEVSHSDGKEHWDIKTLREGPWMCTYLCEDGIDRDYNDLIVEIKAAPKGFGD
jgi:hypothetical protein